MTEPRRRLLRPVRDAREETGEVEAVEPLQVSVEPGEDAAAPTGRERELADEPAVDDGAAVGGPAVEPQAAAELPVPEAELAVPRALVPRWVQLAALPVALLAVWAFAHLVGKVLLLFVIAGLIALILNPSVSFLQRRIPRGLAVLTVYLAFFLVIAGIGVLLANPISNQVNDFTTNLPHLIKEGITKLASVQTYLNHHGLHVQFIKPGHTALQTLQDKVAKAADSLVSFGGGLLTRVISTGFDIVVIFVLSIYMLVYGPRMGELVRNVLPRGNGTSADDYPTLIQEAVWKYVRGQTLFSVIMGTTTGVALYLFGVIGIFPPGKTYAVAFGAFMGAMEFVPYIGPLLGALPPILVALFTNPISALWVALLFLGLQQLEGHIVAPQIFSHSLRINPLLVIFALLCGQKIYGVLGAIVALPIVAVLRETVVYLRRHLVLEPWDRSPGPLL